MGIHQYNLDARRRIKKAVLHVETLPRAKDFSVPKKPIAPQLHRICKVVADIEHNATGSVALQKGNAAYSTLTNWHNNQLASVWNFGQKVWAGSRCIVARAALPEATEGERNLWYIVQAWSATRLRAVAPAAIPAGTTGQINVSQAVDGDFPYATVSAYLPTEHVSVKANAVVWAELVWRQDGSRFEIYSADCDGE